MGRYEVIAVPLSYVNDDGTATIHRKVGTLVEMDDEKAAGLGESLRQLGVEPRGEAPEDDQPTPADGSPATFVDPPVVEPLDTSAAPLPEIVVEPEAPAPRRGRGKADADGQD